jgi:tetratricopeptide (TPR) repeat protein
MLEAVGDPYLAEALFALADLETGLGDPQAGRATSERALRLVRDAGDLFTPWNGLTSLAGAEMGEGRWDRAVELLQEVADLADRDGADYVAANARRNIAIVLRKLGRAAEAHAVMSAQLREWMRVESELNLVWSAEDYGAVLAEAGFPRLAPYLLGAADAARARFGVARDEAQEEEIGDAYSAAREAMTPGEWDVEYERGKRMKVTEAIVEAIEATS